MKISVCIPQYGRPDMVMETINPLLSDSRIDEIILCDDCSKKEDYDKLLLNCKDLEKVRIVKNVKNWHNQHNKRNALSFAKNEWALLIDNDNIFQKDFIDKFLESEHSQDTIYHPAFASPNFDYRQFNGITISKENIKQFCDINIFVTLCNTNNYFVNKRAYLDVYQYYPTVRGADGIYFMYQWIKAGNKLYIMPDATYFHRVHSGSEFLRESDSNMKLIYYWLDKIKEL